MDFLAMIKQIKYKLSQSNNLNLANEILDRQLSGGTGGEVLISVCAKLIEIKHTNPTVYLIINTEAGELINYANSLGMYPTWNGKD